MRHRSAAQRHSDMWEKGRGDGYSPHHLLLVVLAQLNTMCTGSIATDDAIGAVYVHASQPHEQRLYHLCNCQTHSIPARVVLGSSATAAATTPNSSFLYSSFQPAGCIATHANTTAVCVPVCALYLQELRTQCAGKERTQRHETYCVWTAWLPVAMRREGCWLTATAAICSPPSTTRRAKHRQLYPTIAAQDGAHRNQRRQQQTDSTCPVGLSKKAGRQQQHRWPPAVANEVRCNAGFAGGPPVQHQARTRLSVGNTV